MAGKKEPKKENKREKKAADKEKAKKVKKSESAVGSGPDVIRRVAFLLSISMTAQALTMCRYWPKTHSQTMKARSSKPA